MTTAQILAAIAAVSCAVLAVWLGGPVTRWVLGRVDGASPDPTTGVVAAAGILKGGRTIGVLERCAVFLGMLAGWPEALVGVIALKGLGRFAELRGDTEGAAERFLIGSFTSLLWAATLGGLARLALTHAGF